MTEPTWELEGNKRFELRRRLGVGAFGTVYEVFDRERGAKVALKLLKRVVASDLYQFKQEFRALTDLAHPNLVRLYELLTQGDRWFFTMELVEGTSAVAFVRHDHDAREAPTLDAKALSDPSREPAGFSEAAGGRFDEARLRQVLVQLVEGLSALHRAGKMHRDVKPSNVLVTPEGRVALVDFGLVVRLSTSAELSRISLVGTPAYLAPEIVVGEAASEASDWYAVGVLLYEAITGQLPFTGSIHEVLKAKIEGDPPAPSTLVPDLAPDLDRLCVELLSRRADARPAGADLLARVGGAPRGARRQTPFVGRVPERAALVELFREGRRAGGASVALVSGPSGIGKSTLVAQVCLDLQEAAPDAVILAGCCWEQESVPYKAIDGIVDPLSRYLRTLSQRAVAALLPPDVHTLVRLFPVLEQVRAIADAPRTPDVLRGARDLRRGAFRALRQLLARLGAPRPLVLVIEDLHWGDEDSGALLVDLLAPPDPPPLLLIASYQGDEAETSACLRVALPALAAMRGPGLRVASIALDALSAPDAETLARALLPETTAGEVDVAAVTREAGGRPFFIRELAELSSARASRRATPPDGERAISLDALVQARTAELPAGARRLLEVLAVAGRPVDRAAAARAARLGDDEPAAYSALRSARLARGRDAADHDEIEVYHDRIRETVASHLSPARRREAFRSLASALDGMGLADVETLAVYFEQGGETARAAELTVIAAGDAARSLAFDRVARLYRVAIRLRGAGDAQEGPLYEALGEALVTAGRGAEAAEAFALSAAPALPDRAFELRRRAAEQLLFAGRIDQGMAALRANLAEAGIRLPKADALVALGFLLHLAWLVVRGFRLRGRARTTGAPVLRRIDACLAAAKALGTVETMRGAYFGARALVLALGAGDPARTFDALLVFCLYGAALGIARRAYERRALAALADLARTLVDPAHHGDRRSIPRVHASMALLRGALAMVVNDLPKAREPLAEATRILADVGSDVAWELNSVREFTFQRLLWTGAWKELCERLPAALQDARDRGNEHLVRSLTLRFGYVAPLLADDPDAALEVVRAGRQGWWPPRFSTLDCYVLWTRADILLYAAWGRGGEARAHVESMWPALARSPLLRVQLIAGAALGARARAALAFAAGEGVSPADREIALRTAWDCAQRVRAVPDHPAKAMVALVEAGVAAARGDTEGAVARFLLAEAALDAIGCAHYAAAARRRRGALLGGDEGRALVEEADARLRAEGAVSPARLSGLLAPGAVR